MPLNPKKLRMVLAAVAALLLAAVLGFYGYARYRIHALIQEVPRKLGVDVQQSANGFKISKSEGGRMLFSISASSAVQYKGSQRAALRDARIIVFNRGQGTTGAGSDIYDQIYGKQFDYDHSTGEVTATGDVMIDMQAHGKPTDDPSDVTASPGTLHMKTSGLSFNEKTGIAQTDKAIEFALPQAHGSAVGVVYDSRAMKVHLKSNVRITTSATAAKGAGPVDIVASEADIGDDPRQAVLLNVKMHDAEQLRTLSAGRVTLDLRADNTVERIRASDGVDGTSLDPRSNGESTQMHASDALLVFGANNVIANAVLTGAVRLDSKGGAGSEMHASAGKAVLDLAAKNQLTRVHATESVHLANSGGKTKQDRFELQADGVDFFLKPGNMLDRAVTTGAAQVTLNSAAEAKAGQNPGATKTVASADAFEAWFASTKAAKNRLQSLHGTGDTKIVSSAPGTPDRTTTARVLDARFDPTKNGGLTSLVQESDFKYVEGQRKASANKASLTVATDTLVLSGEARVQDQGQGLTLSADSVKMNRKTGDIEGESQVKATYNQVKANPDGALLGGQGNEPIHATSNSMTASKNSGVARFSGAARLWQGANLIEAPLIVFDRDHRTLTAIGDPSAPGTGKRVETAFVQTDKNGKVTPVNVIAGKLSYSDNDRRARFEGGVRLKSADMTMLADHADVYLRAKSAPGGGAKDSASQLERIEAQGNIQIEQENPVRRVTGNELNYTANEGKFVMTGSEAKPPSIFDAERGNVTGDSLTFYIHDDRVQIGSGENSRTVTRTRIKDERKP